MIRLLSSVGMKLTPIAIAEALEREPLVTHTTAAAIVGIAAPNFRRDYESKLTVVRVAAGATTKPLFFKSEVEALASDRAKVAAPA